jgi:hypothetical protein
MGFSEGFWNKSYKQNNMPLVSLLPLLRKKKIQKPQSLEGCTSSGYMAVAGGLSF